MTGRRPRVACAFLYFGTGPHGMLIEMALWSLSLASPLGWSWFHGDMIWMTVLGLALGLGLWQALGAPRRRGRRYFGHQRARVRREHPGQARRMVHHADGLADGEVQMLVGRLRVAGAACESYDQGARVAASTIECPLDEDGRRQHGVPFVALRRRADKLALEVDGASVALEGEVEVLVGSQQAHPRRRLHGLPRTLCERVYRDRPARIDPGVLLHEPPVIRNLAEGQTVLVVGQVTAEGAGAPTLAAGMGQPYRAPAPQRWVLRPAATGAQAPAIAALYAGAPAIPISPWVRFGLGPAAWVAGATAALTLTGALSLSLAWQDDLVAIRGARAGADAVAVALRRDRLPVDAPALAVAAATPFHRGAALDLLAGALARSEARGRDLVEARVAVARLQGHCAAAAAVLREHRQPGRAIDAAQQCVAIGREADQARHVIGRAWMDLGYYDGASEAFAGIRGPAGALSDSHLLDDVSENFDSAYLSEHAMAHALAGAWDRAADALHGLAEHGARSGDRLVYACMAEAAAVRAGQREARERLERLTRSSRSPACALLAADLSQGEARRAWLDDRDVAWHVHGAEARGKRWLYVRELLLRELDTRDVGLRSADSAGTLRLLGAGVLGGDTPYETSPALEHSLLMQLVDHDSLDGEPPTRRERLVRMILLARAVGVEAHLGRPYAAASLSELLMSDTGALATQAGDGDQDAGLRSLLGDAVLLAAVMHWRAGDLRTASEAVERARGVAPATRLEQVESVIAFEARRELQAGLARVLTGRAASAPDAGHDAVLAVARTGDGAALAELVEDARVTPNAIAVLAPALTSGRDALLDVLRWGREPDTATVVEALWHQGARAFAAERLGDRELAWKLREAAHRRYLALQQREPAVLLYLLEHL